MDEEEGMKRKGACEDWGRIILFIKRVTRKCFWTNNVQNIQSCFLPSEGRRIMRRHNALCHHHFIQERDSSCYEMENEEYEEEERWVVD